MAKPRITDHIAHPGPWPVWDWRCRICDEPVDDHIRLWQVVFELCRRPVYHWRLRRLRRELEAIKRRIG